MKTYHGVFEVAVQDVGLARSLATSIVTNVRTTTVGDWSFTFNNQTVSGGGGARLEAWGTAAQLDAIAEQLRAATIKFVERRAPYTPRS